MTHLDARYSPARAQAAIVATNRRSAADDDWPACGSLSKTRPPRALLPNRSPTCASPKGRGSSTTSASAPARDGQTNLETFRSCQQLYDLLSTTVQSWGRTGPPPSGGGHLPPAEGGRHVVAPAQSVKALVPDPKLHGPRGRGCRSHAVECMHQDLHRGLH